MASRFESPESILFVSNEDPLPVRIKYAQTAYGQLSTAEETPQIQLQFPYNINSAQVSTCAGNGGSVTHADDLASVNTGTSADGYAFMASRDELKYNSGEGAVARFSAEFSTGVADSRQTIGIGNREDGYFFGYNGAAFGILRRARGQAEIRTLVVTDASDSNQDITITLDGDADAGVSVTDSSDVDITAREIAAHDYTSLGTGWSAFAAGDTVTFFSLESASKAGAYAISGTSVDGTFAPVTAGSAPEDNWVAKEDWNLDKMDGSGISGQDLDPTKGNVYGIKYKWLGFGGILCSIEDSDIGEDQPVHLFKYSNKNLIPSISNPTFGLLSDVVNLGNTTDLSIKSSSMAAFVEGKDAELGITRSAVRPFDIGNVTVETYVMTIRNKKVYQSRTNRVNTRINQIELFSSLTDARASVLFHIYLGGTPETGTSYTDIDASNSALEVDISATAFDTSNVISELNYLTSAVDSKLIDASGVLNKLHPGQTLLITAEPSKGNIANRVGVSIGMRELF